MAMKRGWVLLLTLAVLLVFLGVANAALTTIGTATYEGDTYNLIYEDNSIYGGLVWLDYERWYSPGFWQDQVDWASTLGGSLTVTLAPGYTTTIDWSTGWRLPATDETKADLVGPWSTDVGDGAGQGWGGPDGTGYYDYYWGYSMVNSELGHLWYESLVGNVPYYDTDGNFNANHGLYDTGPFDYLAEHNYWSSAVCSLNTSEAWFFTFGSGGQRNYSKEIHLYALAVIPGEVSGPGIPAPAPVPEAATMLLMGTGLVGLAIPRIRKKFRK